MALACILFDNQFDNVAGRVFFGRSRNDRPDTEASGRLAFGNGLGRIIRPLGMDIRVDFSQEPIAGAVLEDDDVVDRFEGGEDFQALVEGVDGSAGPFEFSDGRVGIEPKNQQVAQGPAFFEIRDVTAVKEVKTTVGEDNGFAVCAGAGNEVPQFDGGLYLVSPVLGHRVGCSALVTRNVEWIPGGAVRRLQGWESGVLGRHLLGAAHWGRYCWQRPERKGNDDY